MTIGRLELARATMSLNRSPAWSRSPYPSQQMRAGRPWKRTFSRGQPDPPGQRLVVGEQLEDGPVGGGDVLAGSPDSAAQRNGPLPSQNSGRM